MLTSVRWINDYLAEPMSAERQADLLTRAGFPLEGTEEVRLEDGTDVRQDFEMTSNRGDCVSHLGLAREIAALSGTGLKPPTAAIPPDRVDRATAAASVVSVENREPDACPLYTARIIRGVRVGPSPAWLRDRLVARGDIPRNNVVDATNFVLHELGQPTHVFDLAKLAGPAIVVRRAAAGERFLPLGEGAAEIGLHAEDLVIADAERPVALAGVKGGGRSAVTEATTDLLLEAATFAPTAVRSASRRHGISSDSSYRFERGVHPAAVAPAAERLAALLLEVAGGTLLDGAVEDGAPLPAPRVVAVRTARARQLLGIEIPDAAMARHLDALGFAPRSDGGVLHCTVPAHRLDVEREVDLIEEVARMHGLDEIPVEDHLRIRVARPDARESARQAVGDALAGMGFNETVTHSLVGDREAAAFMPPGLDALAVDDERAGAEPVLRPSVVPSLLRVLARNRAHGARDVRLFESAAVFARIAGADEHVERIELGLVDGADDPKDASALPGEPALRRLRGAIDRLVRLVLGDRARVTAMPADAEALPWCDDGVELELVEADGTRSRLGWLGLLAKDPLAPADLDGPVAAAGIALPAHYHAYPPETEARALPAFPLIERDLSIVVEDAVTWATIAGAVAAADPDHLVGIDYVTTWRGKGVGEGRRSLTLRLRFRAEDRTLVHDEVDRQMQRVTRALAERTGGEVRG